MDKRNICNAMSIKFSSSTNSDSCGISSGICRSIFSGKFGSVIRRKFRCCWGGVIVGFECVIVLGIQFIFLPIILIIWGVLIIRGWVWKFRRRGRFGIKI
jgi:hypothetical protein